MNLLERIDSTNSTCGLGGKNKINMTAPLNQVVELTSTTLIFVAAVVSSVDLRPEDYFPSNMTQPAMYSAEVEKGQVNSFSLYFPPDRCMIGNISSISSGSYQYSCVEGSVPL